MILSAFDFENAVETAIAAVLTAAGLNVFTSGQVYDFYKDRPRVQLRFVLGPGHLQWANQNILPPELKGQKIESAYSASLHTTIVTAADVAGKTDQSIIRATVRQVYLNLAPQINGTLLTLHTIHIVKESGSARAVEPDKNSEALQIQHELVLSLHQNVWVNYERITVNPSSGPSIRITT